MKFAIFALLLACAFALATASFGQRGNPPSRSTGPTFPRVPNSGHRYRREAEADPSFGTRRGGWPPRSTGPTIPRFPTGLPRFRREANPQGSVVLQGTQPLSGPDRRPTLDLNYNQRFYDRNGATADAYGGLNKSPGQRVQPHIGIQAERNYGNGFIRGYGQVQPGPRGRLEPTFGANMGFRFRRDAEDFEAEQNVEEGVEAQEY